MSEEKIVKKETTSKKKKFPVSPMGVHKKNLVDERVVVLGPRRIVAEKWLYLQEDFPCGACHQTSGVLFMRGLVGVVRTCEYCGFTERVEPINPDTGEEQARLLERREISIEEAWEILRRDGRHKFPPAGLPRIRRRRRRKPIPEDLEL